MKYRFTTQDHPMADGRKPKDGEVQFALTFPTESDGELTLNLGRIGFVSLAVVIVAILEANPDLAQAVVAAKRG